MSCQPCQPQEVNFTASSHLSKSSSFSIKILERLGQIKVQCACGGPRVFTGLLPFFESHRASAPWSVERRWNWSLLESKCPPPRAVVPADPSEAARRLPAPARTAGTARGRRPELPRNRGFRCGVPQDACKEVQGIEGMEGLEESVSASCEAVAEGTDC